MLSERHSGLLHIPEIQVQSRLGQGPIDVTAQSVSLCLASVRRSDSGMELSELDFLRKQQFAVWKLLIQLIC